MIDNYIVVLSTGNVHDVFVSDRGQIDGFTELSGRINPINSRQRASCHQPILAASEGSLEIYSFAGESASDRFAVPIPSKLSTSRITSLARYWSRCPKPLELRFTAYDFPAFRFGSRLTLVAEVILSTPSTLPKIVALTSPTVRAC